MNKLIRISGNISNGAADSNGVTCTIVDKDKLTCENAINIKKQISDTIAFWNSIPDTFCNPIVSVRHCRIIPKSKRIQVLFKPFSGSINSSIVGASFYKLPNQIKHVIVYRLPIIVLQNAIKQIDSLINTLNVVFGGEINNDQLKLISGPKPKVKDKLEVRNELVKKIKETGMAVSVFCKLIQDISSIERVYVDAEKKKIDEPSYVTLFDTGLSLDGLLSEIKSLKNTVHIGSKTNGYAFLLTPSQYDEIAVKYPYLISMALTDVATFPPIVNNASFSGDYNIPSPTNEPIVGVIDTDFDTRVPFSEWVDYRKESETASNTNHGTAISSLIVDGPLLNPKLEDGCGRFRIRHFSVIGSDEKIYQNELYGAINSIVRENRDIKVWNLSLGTEQEIEKNTISPIGALLDQLQAELDVVFIVAGTNNKKRDMSYPLIGSPADSINSIVVNAVDENGNIPDYARSGPVLEFFPGPTVSAVGGSEEKPITVFTGRGRSYECGTSYAACWVTRKMAYLMHKLNLSRETAKALIIDSAYGWNKDMGNVYLLGAGILPTHIADIIYTPNDEFKVIVTDTCTKYKTYGYNIPLPVYKDRFPFLAKATLCYFPWCSRRHGVDYTLTEIDLHFGQMTSTGIKSIDNNMQGDAGERKLPEGNMKKEFRKWDCVKHISEGVKPRSTGKAVKYRSNNEEKLPYSGWGFSLLKKQRFDNEVMDGYSIPNSIPFSLIMTFKSIDGRNRMDDFVRFAKIKNWDVNIIDVELMAEVIEKGEVELDFTE